MSAVILPVIIGFFIILFGIANMNGNISSVQRYHRCCVAEENIMPFSKAIGMGTVVCGASIVALGAMFWVTEITHLVLFSMIGSVAVVLGLSVGFLMCLYAVIKYNH